MTIISFPRSFFHSFHSRFKNMRMCRAAFTTQYKRIHLKSMNDIDCSISTATKKKCVWITKKPEWTNFQFQNACQRIDSLTLLTSFSEISTFHIDDNDDMCWFTHLNGCLCVFRILLCFAAHFDFWKLSEKSAENRTNYLKFVFRVPALEIIIIIDFSESGRIIFCQKIHLLCCKWPACSLWSNYIDGNSWNSLIQNWSHAWCSQCEIVRLQLLYFWQMRALEHWSHQVIHNPLHLALNWNYILF